MGLGTGRVTHREYRHEGPYFVLSFLCLLFRLLCGVILKRELKSILSIISATGFRKKTHTRQYSLRENRSFHSFSTFDMDKIGKFRQQHWTEHLNISQIAKSESHMSQVSKEIAPQSCENLQKKLHNFKDLYLR